MSHSYKILILVQLGVSVLMAVAILSQNKGAGLSNVFGGTGAIYRTKRGFEKWLFYSTIVLAIVFVGLSLAAVLVSQS